MGRDGVYAPEGHMGDSRGYREAKEGVALESSVPEQRCGCVGYTDPIALADDLYVRECPECGATWSAWDDCREVRPRPFTRHGLEMLRRQEASIGRPMFTVAEMLQLVEMMKKGCPHCGCTDGTKLHVRWKTSSDDGSEFLAVDCARCGNYWTLSPKDLP